MGPRRRIDRLFDCVLTKPTSRPLMWLYCADTRCRHANLLELTTNDLRSFLAMTSSMMPVIINSKPAITSMTAPISVGKRNTTPVFIKSTVTVQHNINPTRPRMKPTPPEKRQRLILPNHTKDSAQYLDAIAHSVKLAHRALWSIAVLNGHLI